MLVGRSSVGSFGNAPVKCAERDAGPPFAGAVAEPEGAEPVASAAGVAVASDPLEAEHATSQRETIGRTIVRGRNRDTARLAANVRPPRAVWWRR
jgi:hypothetical protein